MAEYKPNTKIPCVYMRGGTSKAVFFHDEDLPKDETQRDKVILSAFGSPDGRQIDGMGGAMELQFVKNSGLYAQRGIMHRPGDRRYTGKGEKTNNGGI